MSVEVPVLNANKEPEGQQFYVMECRLKTTRIEICGGARNERTAELNGYLSKEFLEAALDVMRKVVDE